MREWVNITGMQVVHNFGMKLLLVVLNKTINNKSLN